MDTAVLLTPHQIAYPSLTPITHEQDPEILKIPCMGQLLPTPPKGYDTKCLNQLFLSYVISSLNTIYEKYIDNFLNLQHFSQTVFSLLQSNDDPIELTITV